MKKLIMLIAIVALVSFNSFPVFAGSGGEGNNTGCNGVGNVNSPCAGQGGNGGNGGDGGSVGKITITNKNLNKVNTNIKNTVNNNTDVNASSKNTNKNSNEQSQTQKANANNEGVNVQDGDVNIGGSSYEDNSVYLAPPPTTPMVGTVSAQITTPFGGAGFSKDAKHAKLMTTIQFIHYMKENEMLDDSKADEDVLKVYNKLLKTVCGRSCVSKDSSDVDDETGNGGKL